MLTWFLNPKNALLAILSILVASLLTWGLIQQINIERKAAKIQALDADNKVKAATITAQEKAMNAVKAYDAQVKVIEKNTREIRAAIKTMDTSAGLGGEKNEKVIASIIDTFNAGGMLPGSNGAGKTVLPDTITAHP